MTSLQTKTNIGIDTFETIYAEVLSVDYNGYNTEKLYTIICRIVGNETATSGERIQARSVDTNIKRIPIKGEIVPLIKAPSAYVSANGFSPEYYYLPPIPVQSSIHHNAIPGATLIIRNLDSDKKGSYTLARKGFPTVKKLNNEPEKIDEFHQQRIDVSPLQPYSGDLLIESRWGSSIRFSSTITDKKYRLLPSWKKGKSSEGNPLIIISNGHHTKEKKELVWNIENPDKDDAMIYMTSGQRITFKPASLSMSSMKRLQLDGFYRNDYSGKQIGIMSDRIILNSRVGEVSVFGKNGISLSSAKNISVDSKETIELESETINLGLDAKHPGVLGDILVELLSQLLGELSTMATSISTMVVLTGTGPSTPPVNFSQFITNQTNFIRIQAKLNTILSELVYLNKSSGGQSGISPIDNTPEYGDVSDAATPNPSTVNRMR